MKAVQYITNAGAECMPVPVFPSVPLSGAVSLIRSETLGESPFLGFGVAITGSSCYNLAQMPAAEREAFLKSIYGKEGLHLSVGRLSVASSDYSAELYSYDDVANDKELKHFSIERDLAYVIPMVKEILKINPDLYLFASPWSPPAWMKTGGSMGGGYMRREFLDCYADYIVCFIEEYAKHGIKISAITPQNELETDQNGTMPACIWHPDLAAEFAVLLRKKMKEHDLDVEIWIWDHNFDGWNDVKWMLDTHKELPNACNGIAFHYYVGSIEDTMALQQAYPQLPLHFTEGGPRLYDAYDTDFCKWGIMMSKVLNCGYRSFTGWNLMLDQFGGPNVGPFFCGGLVTRNIQTNELTESGQFKAFAHIAKFMQKGAKVFRVESEPYSIRMSSFPRKTKFPLQASGIQNPDGSICYFLVNANEEKKQVQIFENGQWYYVELLPNTIATVVFAE